jgi:DNA polymerase elongation subunit (family B)
MGDSKLLLNSLLLFRKRLSLGKLAVYKGDTAETPMVPKRMKSPGIDISAGRSESRVKLLMKGSS